MKKIIIIGLIIIILTGSGIVYLNNVLLPQTIKSLIIKSIEEQIDSRVTLGSLRVNIFKGLVLKDLNVYKGETALLKAKEVSCIFIPWSLVEKKIAIPVINLNSAQVFMERRKDGTLNLEDLFAPKPPAAGAPFSGQAREGKTSSAKRGFTLIVYRINVSNAKIIFQDSTFGKPFTKNLENLNLAVYLALPASVKFKLSAVIPGTQAGKIYVNGGFKIPGRELDAKLSILNFSPDEFSAYYAASGLKITDDSFRLSADVKMKNNVFYIDAEAQGEKFNISRDKLSARISLDLRAVLEYSLGDKTFKYSGSSKIYDTDISGVEAVDEIANLSCGITFNQAGAKTENLSAQILNLAFKAKAALTNYNDPEIFVSGSTSFSLDALQAILKKRFKFNFGGSINGEGTLSLSARGRLSQAGNLEVKGILDIDKAELKLDSAAQAIQGIKGRIELLKDSLHHYPLFGVSLSSGEISLDSILSFNNHLIKLSKCSGRYYLSEFSASGDIDIRDPSRPEVDLAGTLLVDLKGLDRPFPAIMDQLAKIKPEGKLKAQFNLAGNINAPATCDIEAEFSSEAISLYGLKATDLSFNYFQKEGLAELSPIHINLYGGSLDASFKANLNSKNYPYALDAKMQGVKIEELKLDTQAKAKDIAGIIQGEAKLSGLLAALADSQGAGMIDISKGKLWELDLFKGLGKFIFSKDLANIIFSEGKCDFVIKEKAVLTDNLALNSNMVNLSGPVRIGFDGSINARLNVDIISNLVPLTGTFKDVTTAIAGATGKFAQIRISGTLKEPKYKFDAAVVDIIQGLANTFLKRI